MLFMLISLLERALHYKGTDSRSQQQKHKFYVNKQPAFHGKQPNTHLIVKRQTMLTLLSNSRNLGGASPSFGLSVYAHTEEFSFYAHKEFNKSCGMMICIQNTQKHKLLHRNSTQEGESNLKQSSSTHKQST